MPYMIIQAQCNPDHGDKRIAKFYADEKEAMKNAIWLRENGYEYHDPVFFNSVQFNESDMF